jgi:plastocyanin
MADASQARVGSRAGPTRFSSPAFNRGGTYRATFTRPGVYRYLCTYHPATMKGTVTVVR